MTFTIAHRGYKDKYPENTFAAFKGAAAIGVDMIETDLQITKDGHVVINHDPATGRTWSKNLVIAERYVEDLKELTNLQDNEQKIVTLRELFEWVVEETPRLMLDIKAFNDVTIIAKVVRIMREVKDDLSYWQKKLIFGLWTVAFYEFGVKTTLLKGFEIINISISPSIARQFIAKSLEINDPEYALKGISLLNVSLLSPEFAQIHNEIKANGVDLYVWTSNTTQMFDLARHFQPAGIITDKPVELQEYLASNTVVVPFKFPPLFSRQGAELAARFAFFRVFEFIVLRNLFIYRPVRVLVTFLLRLAS